MRFVASIFSICRAAYRVDLVSEIPVLCVASVDHLRFGLVRIICIFLAAIIWLWCIILTLLHYIRDWFSFFASIKLFLFFCCNYILILLIEIKNSFSAPLQCFSYYLHRILIRHGCIVRDHQFVIWIQVDPSWKPGSTSWNRCTTNRFLFYIYFSL